MTYILFRCDGCSMLYAVQDVEHPYSREHRERLDNRECMHCKSGDVSPIGKVDVTPV